MSIELKIPVVRFPAWIAGCISPRKPRSSDMSDVVDAICADGRSSLMSALLDDLRAARRHIARPVRPG